MHCISGVVGGHCGNFISNSSCDGDQKMWKGLICQIKIKLVRQSFAIKPTFEGNDIVTPIEQRSEMTFQENLNQLHGNFLANSEVDTTVLVAGNIDTKIPFFPLESPINMEPEAEMCTYECENCGKAFKTDNTLKKHRKICKHGKVRCKQCSAQFGNEELLKEHVELVHKSLNWQCASSTERFGSEEELVQHFAGSHEAKSELETSQKVETETSVELNATVNEEGKWPCSICNKVMSNKANLQQHFQTHTATDKIFTCEQCDAKFSQQLYLKSHVRRVHCPAESCIKCGALVKRDSMRKHILRAHGKPSKYRCTVCYEEFKNNDKLLEHKKSHKVIHQCELCGKTFERQSALKYHIEWHSEVPKYNCDLCDKKFYVQSALRKHKNSVHAPSRDFKCEVCGKAFKTFTVFKNHRDIHENERKHKCKVCGKGFNSNGSLVNHKRVHEREWMLDA